MSKYGPEIVDAVADMALRGYTNKGIINALGISSKTFYEWLKNEPEFKNTIHQNRKVVAQTVVPKLLRKAKGFRYTEKTQEYKINVKGERVLIGEKTVSKHVPPDTGAIKYILNNWDSENWADKQSMEHQIPDGYGVIVLPGVKSTKEWEDSANRLDTEGEL